MGLSTSSSSSSYSSCVVRVPFRPCVCVFALRMNPPDYKGCCKGASHPIKINNLLMLQITQIRLFGIRESSKQLLFPHNEQIISRQVDEGSKWGCSSIERVVCVTLPMRFAKLLLLLLLPRGSDPQPSFVTWVTAAELRWKRVWPLDGTEQRGWLEIGWWCWWRFVATPRRLKSEVEVSE